MACNSIQLPDGSAAIICGLRRTKTKQCKFCDNRSTKLCDWQCERPEKVHHSKIRPGDTIVTQQKGYRLEVQGLHRFEATFRRGDNCIVPAHVGHPDLPLIKAGVTMYGLNFPDGRSFLYYQTGDTKVQVLRPGTCDAPCCDLHSRHVDDDVDYCQEHYSAWEEVK